jgi:hypothetical protein
MADARSNYARALRQFRAAPPGTALRKELAERAFAWRNAFTEADTALRRARRLEARQAMPDPPDFNPCQPDPSSQPDTQAADDLKRRRAIWIETFGPEAAEQFDKAVHRPLTFKTSNRN